MAKIDYDPVNQTTVDESANQEERMDLEQPTNEPLFPTHSDRAGDNDDGGENARLLLSSRSVSTSEDNHDDDDDNNDDDNEEEDEYENYESPSSWKKKIERVLQRTLLPDNIVPSVGSLKVVEGPFTIKLLKFILLSFAFIVTVHGIVPYLTDDRDRNLRLRQMLVFEGNLIVSDLIVFFLVGRMWRHNGVDRLEFVLWGILANMFLQTEPYIRFLQHSVSLYEMHCVWPWQLWVFAVTLIPLISNVVFLHIKYAYQNGILLIKISEFLLCALFFVAPLAPSPYFHLHHWYAGWLLGMHANFPDAWWSRAAMAYCWGLYINGIAVYGRDPVLTCEYSYFLSVDQGCPYIDCYQDNTTTNETVKQMITPDWKNCSADTYHP